MFFSGHCLLPGIAEGPLLPGHLLSRERSDNVPRVSLLLVAISGLGHLGVCGGLHGLYVEQSPISSSSGALTPFASGHRPWSYTILDFVAGLLVSKGNVFILTGVDHFSKAITGIGPPLCCCNEAVKWTPPVGRVCRQFPCLFSHAASSFEASLRYQNPLFANQEHEIAVPISMAVCSTGPGREEKCLGSRHAHHSSQPTTLQPSSKPINVVSLVVHLEHTCHLSQLKPIYTNPVVLAIEPPALLTVSMSEPGRVVTLHPGYMFHNIQYNFSLDFLLITWDIGNLTSQCMFFMSNIKLILNVSICLNILYLSKYINLNSTLWSYQNYNC